MLPGTIAPSWELLIQDLNQLIGRRIKFHFSHGALRGFVPNDGFIENISTKKDGWITLRIVWSIKSGPTDISNGSVELSINTAVIELKCIDGASKKGKIYFFYAEDLGSASIAPPEPAH